MVDAVMSAGLAHKQFEQAVDALLEPQIWWDGHEVRKVPSLYRRVRDALTGQARGGRSVAQSKPPANIHALDWCRRLTLEVRAWHGGGVECALPALVAAPFDKDSASVLLERAGVLQRFVVAGLDVVGDVERPIPLRRACPAAGCGAMFRYASDGQRRFAVLADPASGVISCGVCHAEWPQERWGLLAGMWA